MQKLQLLRRCKVAGNSHNMKEGNIRFNLYYEAVIAINGLQHSRILYSVGIGLTQNQEHEGYYL
jgi:hypothetical protein